ncbi:T9SS type A sorting domain-containing protein [Chryseobacterium sp. JUb7]|uniref:T9SS type A sorting domain-containing protein n=1 Tax=Chryseobacterium sp. JUb7 TaxID=2940599 RepID=UPI0021673327|nr:T9SS type A sorting domain-containing protein [Chryseobacterium sp. JUb7]MCS3530422.1 hypothetical protein [Chryseobacterium sp. JUb7]
MKKLLFSAALVSANLVFGQITLEHTFTNEKAYPYITSTETYYIAKSNNNNLKIYNSDYSLYKTVNVPVPANYNMIFYPENNLLTISKHVFNTDNKFEFLVEAYGPTQNPDRKLLLIDEDGNLLKDFHQNSTLPYGLNFEIFHDSVTNINKIIVYSNTLGLNPVLQSDVYVLPTSVLAAKEIQAASKLSAFPVPTSKILHIMNPGNGANKVQVYDITGKLVSAQSFSVSDSKISIDVESLPKGIYIYKIGELSSKFTKN